MSLSLELLQAQVQELLDREAIRACLARYARGVDRFDRDLILSAYHPDAIDDHGKFVGNPREFVEWALGQHARMHLSHMHCLMNHLCEIDGAVAYAETYFMFACMSREGVPLAQTGGRYLDRLEKRDGEWKIAYRACTRDWAMTSERPDFNDLSTLTSTRSMLSDEMRAFMNAGPAARRDRSDPSYQRPLQANPERVAEYARLRRGPTAA